MKPLNETYHNIYFEHICISCLALSMTAFQDKKHTYFPVTADKSQPRDGDVMNEISWRNEWDNRQISKHQNR